MSKLIDLTGQRFGRLTVIERAGVRNGNAAWLCRCDCGKQTVVSAPNLKSGSTRSCGCFKRAAVTEKNIKHEGRYTRLYQIWSNMIQRCTNKRIKRYPDYGGRGIMVCDEWLHDFTTFRDWALSNGYAEDLTIDRIDNDKGYNPDNCRWATKAEQNRNQRPRRWAKRPKTE